MFSCVHVTTLRGSHPHRVVGLPGPATRPNLEDPDAACRNLRDAERRERVRGDG